MATLLLILASGCNYRSNERLQVLAESGDAEAQLPVAKMYAFGEEVPKNDKTAVKWYAKAAKQGDAKAQHNIGVMYAKGKGVLTDIGKAYVWFDLAAYNDYERGAEAKNIAGKQMTDEQIRKVQHLSKACIEALKWYQKSANHGFAKAHVISGVMYDNGKGIPESDVKA